MYFKAEMQCVDHGRHCRLTGAAHVAAALSHTFGFYYFKLLFKPLYGFHLGLALIFVGDIDHHEKQGGNYSYSVAGKEVG